MMLTESDIHWADSAPHFKYGTFVRRTKTSEPFTPEEIELLPPQHDYFKNNELMVERNKYVRFSSSQTLATARSSLSEQFPHYRRGC